MRVEKVEEFIELLRHSQLLSAEQMFEAQKLGAGDAQSLARKLFRRGWLTRWQALTLLEGRNQFFLGKYKLLELIGTGGMGAVFKAIRPEMGRIVALKVLKSKVVQKSTGVPRFLREIRSAAALDHPNIVRAFDADQVNDTYVLVMEYVEGRDLKHYLTGQPDLPIPWVCECMRQAALGLQHAADRGTVHRDIKPANIIVSQATPNGSPQVKLLDFGLARFASEGEEEEALTRLGQAVGTPDYISPEQAQNSRLADIRADIYSLGCTFFELLTGKIPFPGASLTEKLVARVRTDAPRVRELRPDIPARLDAIIARMLARNPADRYQTPAELARDLAEFSLNPADASRPQEPLRHEGTSDWDISQDQTLGAFLEKISDSKSNSIDLQPLTSNYPERPESNSLRTIGLFIGAIILLAALLAALFFGLPKSGKKTAAILDAPGTDEHGTVADQSPIDKAPWYDAAVAVLKLGGTLLAETDPAAVGAVSWPPAEPDGSQRMVVEINNPTQLTPNVRRIVGAELRVSDHVTNFTLERLAEIESLEQVILAGCKITDPGLIELSRLPRLRQLDISSTQITDLGLQNLKQASSLEELNLLKTSITGEGLTQLGNLPRLRRLNLGFTRMTPSAFGHLESFTAMESLTLDGVKLPPGAIDTLVKLTGLKELNLQSTNIPDAALSRLKQALPRCRISP